MMKKYQTRDLALGGMIAALYVVLTFVAPAAGLASGEIQVRISYAPPTKTLDFSRVTTHKELFP